MASEQCHSYLEVALENEPRKGAAMTGTHILTLNQTALDTACVVHSPEDQGWPWRPLVCIWRVLANGQMSLHTMLTASYRD